VDLAYSSLFLRGDVHANLFHQMQMVSSGQRRWRSRILLWNLATNLLPRSTASTCSGELRTLDFDYDRLDSDSVFLFPCGGNDHSAVDKDARIQFIKDQLDFSKLLFFGLLGAYIGVVVSWYNAVHANTKDILSNNPGDLAIMDTLMMCEISIMSLFFLFGPIFEIAKQRRRISEMLLAIPKDIAYGP
jgi:hypothetical protein